MPAASVCCPPLSKARRLRRMAWLVAQASRRFPVKQWRLVLFTDESRFTHFCLDGRRRVYRLRGERFADACVDELDRFEGVSIIVWGGIAHGVRSQLIVVDGNMTTVSHRDEILCPVAIPLVQERQLILQQDNARPHVARACRNFLANNSIVPLYSPASSPLSFCGTIWTEG